MIRKLVLSMTLVLAATAAFAVEDGKEDVKDKTADITAGQSATGALSAAELNQHTAQTMQALQTGSKASTVMAKVLADPATSLNNDQTAAANAAKVGNRTTELMASGLNVEDARAKALKDVLGRDVSDKELTDACGG